MNNFKGLRSAAFRASKSLGSIAFLLCFFLSLQGCAKKTADDLYLEAVEAINRGDMFGAMTKCNKIIENHADSPIVPRARMLLGDLMYRNNDPQRAYEIWTEVIQLHGLKSQAGWTAFNKQLQFMADQGKIPEMIAMLEQTSSTLKVADLLASAQATTATAGPTMVAATSSTLSTGDRDLAWAIYIKMGQAYAMNKQIDKSIHIFNTLKEAADDEQNAILAVEQAVGVLSVEKRFQQAIDLYMELLDKYPDSSFKGAILFGVGVFHKSIAEETKDEAVKTAEMEISRKYMLDAIAYFEKELVDELAAGQQILYSSRIALVHQELGDETKALEILEKSLADHPEERDRLLLYRQITDTHIANKDLEKAKAVYMRIAKDFEGDMEISRGAFMAIRNVDAAMEQEKRNAAAQAADRATTATAAGPTTATVVSSGPTTATAVFSGPTTNTVQE